jgi:hypothetical protein
MHWAGVRKPPGKEPAGAMSGKGAAGSYGDLGIRDGLGEVAAAIGRNGRRR